jgi:hypothetical protein
MATIVPVIEQPERYVFKATWTGLTSSSTCAPITGARYYDKTVQLTPAGAAVTVKIQGSNDGTNYSTLNDPSETEIALTSGSNNSIKVILENPFYIKPVITTAVATMNCNVIIVGREEA